MAVAIENLYSGGKVDDIEAVFAIDGDGARLMKVSVLDAMAAPDNLGPAGVAGAARQNAGGQKTRRESDVSQRGLVSYRSGHSHGWARGEAGPLGSA